MMSARAKGTGMVTAAWCHNLFILANQTGKFHTVESMKRCTKALSF